MANVKVTGDFIQVKSTITQTMYEKAKAYKPEALELKDEEGNPTFKVMMGNASQSKYGVSFSNTDSEGRLFVTSENPCHDHSDPEQERNIIKEAYAVVLANLRKVEAQVAEAASELNSLEAAVEDAIEFTDCCSCERANFDEADLSELIAE